MAGRPRTVSDGSHATLRWMKSWKRPGNGTLVNPAFLPACAQPKQIWRRTEVQVRVQQQTDYHYLGLVPDGWDGRSLVPPDLHSGRRHRGMRRLFSWDRCAVLLLNCRLAFCLLLEFVIFPVLLMGHVTVSAPRIV